MFDQDFLNSIDNAEIRDKFYMFYRRITERMMKTNLTCHLINLLRGVVKKRAALGHCTVDAAAGAASETARTGDAQQHHRA